MIKLGIAHLPQGTALTEVTGIYVNWLKTHRKIFQLAVTSLERRHARQLTFFRLKISTKRYSEVHSTKYRPVTNMNHFSLRGIKMGNRFQPTVCQGCMRKIFTIMTAPSMKHSLFCHQNGNQHSRQSA